ncbi:MULTISPECIES: protein-methionine-sulfoxide reductase heme-binding subunit MsrQ [unclassified Thauera]|uniref:sulfite oxidase heme-binding subunit YedZ n=1 Tax=unclassified Thauera TaxID=2609274 RepID=UPI0002CF1E05|nr:MULTISPECIES: protein-methionine-sulfoxide reductase heme-binding subunit MsrQ [unclassified Thauera]ENO91421.1 ferric reductase domain-containing transmembrane protein [Thauera sp. 28]WBL65389.1 sulfoxide reductase heme-binding subunit YedZ [Thauera sp. WB-2]HAG76381.1 sulfoxide reductase heme-binding subunit YedZ [Thauera sp.]HNR59855.1 protein-methionine-sulfoxide reductase heme-binding subunit MsrQ [Thauera sp.]HNS91637.1 protein-methionine-sulfoxide reductase heme-binding subunit MsrQ 
MLRTPSPLALNAIKALVFVLCLIPAGQLALGWQADTLGANPIETLTHATGDWALRLLLLTLAVTPLRRLSGLHWLLRLRRMLGLFAFAYALGHFAIWIWLDLYLDWPAIARDILERPFVTVGFAALVLMIPLAATSNTFAIRRMGGRRWQALHRATYGIAILGVLHFWWLVKADVLEPLVYALVLAVLLGLRAWWREQERQRQLSVPPPAKHLQRPVIRIMPK